VHDRPHGRAVQGAGVDWRGDAQRRKVNSVLLRGSLPNNEFPVYATFRHATSRHALTLHSSLAGIALLGRQSVASDQRVLPVLRLAVIEPAAPGLAQCSASFPKAGSAVLVRLAALAHRAILSIPRLSVGRTPAFRGQHGRCAHDGAHSADRQPAKTDLRRSCVHIGLSFTKACGTQLRSARGGRRIAAFALVQCTYPGTVERQELERDRSPRVAHSASVDSDAARLSLIGDAVSFALHCSFSVLTTVR